MKTNFGFHEIREWWKNGSACGGCRRCCRCLWLNIEKPRRNQRFRRVILAFFKRWRNLMSKPRWNGKAATRSVTIFNRHGYVFHFRSNHGNLDDAKFRSVFIAHRNIHLTQAGMIECKSLQKRITVFILLNWKLLINICLKFYFFQG